MADKKKNDSAPVEFVRSSHVFARAERLAAALFDDPQTEATTVLTDGETFWINTSEGIIRRRAPIADEVVTSGRMSWTEDARADPAMAKRSFVAGPPYARMCVVVPIVLEDGAIAGVLSIISPTPVAYDQKLADRLADLAGFVADEWTRLRAQDQRDDSARERDVARRTLSEVFANAPVSMLLIDRDLTILDVSPTWLARRGMTRAEAVGRHLKNVTSSVFAEWRPYLDRCLAGETVAFDRVPMVLANGSRRWVQTRLSPWRDHTGEVGGVILMGHDVTDLVEALDRKVRSEEWLRLAVEVAGVRVWEKNFDSQELATEGAAGLGFFAATGFDDGPDVGEWAPVDARDRDAVLEAWRRFMEEGQPFHPEFRMQRADGGEVWVVTTARAIRDEAGQLVRIVGAMQDITERKAQEQALIAARDEAEEAARAKSAFLATMSHEIRTPLNGVLGMAQAMTRGELDTAQRGRLEVIRQSGESLLTLLNDLLDFSKIEAGKLTLEDGEFDIEELAKGACATFEAVADAKGLEFRLDVDKGARGRYRGDPVRVRQVLCNLVSNALKFTERGQVAIRVRRRGEILSIDVSDSGIGMSPEQSARLFRAFEQAEASTTRRFGGTGLGLAICRDLAELMNGRITVKTKLGEGSTFTLRVALPKIAARPESAPTDLDDAQSATRPLRVLAAEDNSVNQLVLKTLLGQMGVDPELVFDGRAAVDAWAREPWDLILMDVQMPVLDGPAAVAEIRAREAAEGRPRTPIVALTANAMDHQVAQYLDAGMDGYVAKPIEASRLFAALEAALSGAPQPGAAEVAQAS